MEDLEHVRADETLSILQQCLSALTYLHGNKPPIVHRDIKPGNILVQHRFPGDIYVKFGDFGLSRDGYELSSICGTRKYLAPEIYLKWQSINSGGEKQPRYTPAVDVWSLGVVAYELVCALPWYENDYRNVGPAWCEKIVQIFQKDTEIWPDELRKFLLKSMVVISSESRLSARDSYDQAMLLPHPTEARCQTPRPTPPHTEEHRHATLRYSAEDHVTDTQRTTVWRPRPSADECATVSMSSHESGLIKSEVPPPESTSSLRTSRKRAAVSKLSSSSTRQQIKRREDPSQRESASSQQPELEDLSKAHSADPLDPLHVKSTPTSIHDIEPRSWVRQDSRVDAQISRNSSIPRS